MEIQTTNQKEYLDAQYDLFLHEYTRLNPQPSTDTTGQRRALLVMLIAAVIVSARHNIPFFLGKTPDDVPGQIITVIIAISVVAMVEIGLVKLGEFIIEYLDIEFVQWLRPWLLLIGLFLLLTVAIFSNVLDQLTVKNIAVNENLKTAITILAGLTAPIMALITGVIFASLELKVAQDQNLWNKKFQQQWRTFKTQNEISITVQAPPIQALERVESVPQLPNSNSNWNGNGKSGSGFQRVSSAMEQALEHYRNNPDDLKRSPLKVCKEVGVSKSTMYDAKKIVESEIGE